MKEINNTKELTNEELLNISAGGSCTWKKGIIEGVSGAMIGGLAGPWG
ncbi:bacteriocin leader domain-containing protein, partial [Bacillus thuringiensis serovar londrina]